MTGTTSPAGHIAPARGEDTFNPAYTAARREVAVLVPSTAKRLLDVGCYTGGFGAEIKRTREVEIWGVEPVAEAAAVAAQHLDRVIVGRFEERVPIPDAYFDAVTFNDSLEHFADPVAPLLLARRKVTPDGVLVCVLPNMRYIEDMIHLLFERDWRYEEAGVRDRTHLRFFTRKSMSRLFTELGFEIVQQVGLNSFWWRPARIVPWMLVRVAPCWFGDMRYQQYATVLRARDGAPS